MAEQHHELLNQSYLYENVSNSEADKIEKKSANPGLCRQPRA
jgi:hypothetical protein